MQMEDNFNEFINNLQIDNFDDINTSLEGIAKKLNQKYYDNFTTENYLIVGSMGRNTSIKGESDIDVIYELPDEVFERLDDYESNGQSQLLNEIRDTLKEKYPSTDIKGDGQVVVMSLLKSIALFSDSVKYIQVLESPFYRTYYFPQFFSQYNYNIFS